jgi:serine/threonine protein phosphatase 1
MDRLLGEVHLDIAADLAARPIADHRIIHVGDYVDRGPESAAVIERLARLCDGDQRVVCLRGNHDQMMLAFLSDPVGEGPNWLYNGGETTLAAYGVGFHGQGFSRLAERLARVLPDNHRAFLEGLPFSARVRDYFFCHAGICPGIPLDQQTPEDLTWIREEFLFDRRDHGVVVVHGHTIAKKPELLPNRINIDTGAYSGGPLTVLALEGARYRFL